MEQNLKKKPRKETGNYCFPKPVANIMMSISPRTQMEASIMAMVVILCGMVFTGVYIAFYVEDISTLFRVITIINTLAGMVFLGTFLVTSFQQYKNFLIATGVVNVE